MEGDKNLNIPEINSFINGIERDMEAVRNAINMNIVMGLQKGALIN